MVLPGRSNSFINSNSNFINVIYSYSFPWHNVNNSTVIKGAAR